MDSRTSPAGALGAGPPPHAQTAPSSQQRVALSDHEGAGILEWFEDATRQFHECIAIRAPEGELSYGQLADQANRIANCLLANELGPGSIVAVALENRSEMIAAVLGIFKAGGVYAPLDTEFPEERLRHIMGELSPAALITYAGYYDTARRMARGVPGPCKVMTLDGRIAPGPPGDTLVPIDVQLQECSTDDPRIPVDPDALRYIVYTSGSTGRPKGIAGRLAGLSHFIKWEIETFEIGPGWRVSQLSAPTFDAFFRDMFVPLCSGGTICVPAAKPSRLEPNALVEWFDADEVNLIHCVPSLFGALLWGDWSTHRCEGLRYVLMAGEVLQVAHVANGWNSLVTAPSWSTSTARLKLR